MTAKNELFERLEHLDTAINLPQMMDEGVARSSHNGVANLLRKGIGIVAFNILEDFIKNRAYEALDFVSNSNVAFEKLPDSLQIASIAGALDALAFKAKLVKKTGGDWKLLVQDEAFKIHSTKMSPYALSQFSFFSANSNIGDSEVPDLLKAFGISGGWSQIKVVSDSIGGGLPDLSQAYKNAATRRHSAAHVASFRYEYQWLKEIKKEILVIAASLDLLLTGRCRQISSNLGKTLVEHNISDALKYRFLEKDGALYRETTEIGGRAKKRWDSLNGAITALSGSLIKRNEFLMILDDTRRISDWRT